MQIAELRLLAKTLKIVKIDSTINGGFIEFSENAELDPMKFVQFIQSQPSYLNLTDRLSLGLVSH